MTNQIMQLVLGYNGTNNFMNSLKFQAGRYGRLSPKQLECAARFFQPSEPVEVKPVTYSMIAGERFTIRKWFANVKAKDLNMRFFFRNLIVEEVLAETSKAIHVKVRFDSKIATSCHCCGKNLDNDISKATGIGPVCAKKYFNLQKITMNDAQLVLSKIEEEAKIAGVIGPIWIPKRQIVSKAEQILFDKE